MKSFAARLSQLQNNIPLGFSKSNQIQNQAKLSTRKGQRTNQEVSNFKKNFEDLQITLRFLENRQPKTLKVGQFSKKPIEKESMNLKKQDQKILSVQRQPFSRLENKKQSFNNEKICNTNATIKKQKIQINNSSLGKKNKSITQRLSIQQVKNIENIKEPNSNISSFRQNYIKNSNVKSNQKSIKLGIPNIGNTCYINSNLQCLFHLPNFNKIFQLQDLQQQLNPKHKGTALRYSQLYQKIKNGQAQDLSTFYLKRAVSKKCSLFIQWNQEDAHQFIRQLLDTLHDDFNRINQKIQYKQLQSDRKNRTLSSIAIQYWNYYRKKDDSLIIDYFCGQLMSSVTCLGCNFESLSFDNFLDLSLPMQRGPIKIEQLLENFLQCQQLNDLYLCSKCKSYNKCTRKLDLWKVPKLLMIHFKRFKYGKYKTQKLRDRITLPVQNLNIQKFMNISNDPSVAQAQYQLIGYVSHTGTMQGGHYYAHCFDKKNKKWYKLDDDQVTETKAEKSSEYIYIAFFSRKDNKQ